MFKPRPKQAEVLSYTGGRMGVSAVPGSGKTQTLSALAAKLVARGDLGRRSGGADRHAGQLGGGQLRAARRRVCESGAACCRTSATGCGRCTGWPTTSCASGPGWWGCRTTSRSWTNGTPSEILKEAAEAWGSREPRARRRIPRARTGRPQARLGAPRAVARRCGQHRCQDFIRTGEGPASDARRIIRERAGPRCLSRCRCWRWAGRSTTDYQRALSLPRRGGLRRPDPAGLAGAAARRRIPQALRIAGPTSWRTRRRTAAACRRTSCACWPGRTGRQLGARRRSQPGDLRDVHDRQPEVSARFPDRSKA